MTWLVPLWLLLLVPWAALCVWGVSGGPARPVPFLPLWPGDRPTSGGGRYRPPPAWAILLLIAALLTVLAAAAPAWRSDRPELLIAVDRTPGMTTVRVAAAVGRLGLPAGTRVRWVGLPDTAATPPGPTALCLSAGQLADAVRRLGPPFVLVGDRDVPLPPGGVRVGPPKPLDNVGIDRFAVVAGNRPQAMVRVFNANAPTHARLRVDGADRPVDLPTGTTDFFIDVPPPAATCVATLLRADGRPWSDDVPGDDSAYLARTTSPARVVPATNVPASLSRMIAVYAAHRPAAADAPPVVITRDRAVAGPAVLLPAATTPGDASAVSVDADHPVVRSLARELPPGDAVWPSVARAAGPPPGDGWRTLVRAGDAVLLAVREAPRRQAWVGFDANALANRPVFVLFWADVFDWLGGGPAAWTAGPVCANGVGVAVADGGLDASPGLYRDDRGRVTATAMPAARPGVSTPPSAVPARVGVVERPLSPWLLAAATLFSGFALWRLNLTES